MNIWKQIKINNLKEKTKPVDAKLLFKFIMETRDSATDEEKKHFIESLEKGFKSAGEACVKRALLENVMTKKEWKSFQDKGFKYEDMSTVLQAYFNKKDDYVKEDDKVVCVTQPYSLIFKHRKFLKKRFDVTIISPEEAVKIMEKEKKND